MRLSRSARLIAAFHQFTRGRWLPAGFFLFLVGLFVLPGTHNYKVVLNFLLLLPALLCVAYVPDWWRFARRGEAAILLALAAAYLLYLAGSAAYRAPDGVEFLQWSLYIGLFLLGVGLCMRITTRQLLGLLLGATCVAAFAALYAMVRDVATGATFVEGYRLTGYGALYNPLRSGHLWGVFFVLGAGLALSGALSRAQRRLAVAASAMIFLAILLTGSRSPLLALFAVGLCWALFMAPSRQRWWGVVAVLLAALVALAVFWPALMERGWSLRPELWGMVLAKLPQHRWLGAGLGTEIVLRAGNGLTYYDPHNVLLAALYYGGVVGLLLFVALFAYAFRLAWRWRERSSLCALAAPLQVFGIVTLQFDGGSLIGRPTEF